jgi:hypothetical protein
MGVSLFGKPEPRAPVATAQAEIRTANAAVIDSSPTPTPQLPPDLLATPAPARWGPEPEPPRCVIFCYAEDECTALEEKNRECEIRQE